MVEGGKGGRGDVAADMDDDWVIGLEAFNELPVMCSTQCLREDSSRQLP